MKTLHDAYICVSGHGDIGHTTNVFFVYLLSTLSPTMFLPAESWRRVKVPTTSVVYNADLSSPVVLQYRLIHSVFNFKVYLSSA